MNEWEKKVYREIEEDVVFILMLSFLFFIIILLSYMNMDFFSVKSWVIYFSIFLSVLLLLKLSERITSSEGKDVSFAKKIFLILMSAFSLAVVYFTGLSSSMFKAVFFIPAVLASLIYGRKAGLQAVVIIAIILFLSDLYLIDAVPNKMLEADLVLSGNLLLISWLIGGMRDKYKAVGEHLAFEKNFMNDLLDNLPVAVIMFRNNGEVRFANKTTCSLFGYDSSELEDILQGNGNANTLINDLKNRFVNNVFETSFPLLNQRCRLTHKNGSSLAVNVDVYPMIYSRSGENKGAIAIINDLTSELEYMELKQQSHLILNSIQTGVIVTDENGFVRIINPAAEKILNITKEDADGRLIDSILSLSIKNSDQLLQQLHSNRDLQNTEAYIEENRTILVNKHRLNSNNCLFQGDIIVLNDITEKKEFVEYIRRAGTLAVVGEMAAGIAHEIKNPITTVRGFLQLLKEKTTGNRNPANLKEYCNIMINEMDRINNIVRGFLLLAKPSKPNWKSCNVNDIIENVCKLVESEAFLNEVNIIFNKNKQLIEIWADEEQLKQVFLNVIMNGLQSMKHGGILEIQSAVLPGENLVRISITDQGCGMSKDICDKVFNPFFTTKDEGTGLGLSISERIVSDHAGKIELDSEIGKGTTVNIMLPVFKE